MELKEKQQFIRNNNIPESWLVIPLNEVTTEIGDGIHTTPKYVDQSDYYFINGNNLNNGQIVINENTKCVSINEHQKLKKNLNKNTILMSINGTIGKLAFYNNEKVVLGKSAAYITVNTKIKKKYLYYALQSMAIEEYFENELTGSTIRNLSLESIRNTPLPLPPKNEQHAIAQVLSDVDALIEAQEALIEKKRLIKQGVMQELLTGKQRLPGYYKKWKQIQLGDIANIYQPTTISQNDLTKDGYLVYGANGVIGRYSKYNHKKWQITITCRGSTCGTVNKTEKKCWITGNAMVINCDDYNNINKDFLFFLLSNQDFDKLITGSGQPQIVRTPLQNFLLKIPGDISEQEEIAVIFLNFDNEIKFLEKKLKKLQMIKQGMMQELLTGRTRLV